MGTVFPSRSHSPSLAGALRPPRHFARNRSVTRDGSRRQQQRPGMLSIRHMGVFLGLISVPVWLVWCGGGNPAGGAVRSPVVDCGSDRGRCGGECIDLRTNTRNCGRCGHVCGSAEACVGSVCRPACPAETTVCGGECVSVDSDAEHCGACDAGCGDGLCAGGVCQDTCPYGSEQCGRACVDLTSDPLHCGGCEDACDRGERCVDGRCTCISSTNRSKGTTERARDGCRA